MNDETNTNSEPDDTEAHGYKGVSADGTDDTEADGFRGGQSPAGEDDDTEGHVYPAGEDERDKRGQNGAG